MKYGLTLLETLISMLIVSVGIIGLLSLLPVAARQAHNGAVNDRKMAAGKNAVADFHVREMHDQRNWMRNNSRFSPVAYQGFVIDPMIESRHGNTLFPAWTGATQIPRITLRSFPDDPQLSQQLNIAQADYIFSAHDDLVFEDNPDSTLPPIQQLDSRVQGPDKPRLDNGAFSWMVTMTPRFGVPYPEYVASFVVFYNRDLRHPSLVEKVVHVSDFSEFHSGGIAGGDLHLSLMPGGQRSDLESIKKDSWVMLKPSTNVHYFRWYRVSDVADVHINAGQPELEVTLDGSDWPIDPQWIGAALRPGFRTPQVTVVPGVVAVYERSFRLNSTSLWKD